MIQFKTKLGFISILSLFGVVAMAGNGRLASADSNDLVAASLMADHGKKRELPAAREALNSSWALDEDAVVQLGDYRASAVSKRYTLTIRSQNFHEGISLPVTAPGVLVRLSPVVVPGKRAAASLGDLADLVFVNEAGSSFSGGSGVEWLVTPEQLEKAGSLNFPEGTAVFRVGEQLGKGELFLFAENVDSRQDGTFLLDVFEKASELELEVQTDRDAYLSGQTLSLRAGLFTDTRQVAVDHLEGRLMAPDGTLSNLSFDLSKMAATAALNSEMVSAQGLWKIRVTATGTHKGMTVRRDATVAFAVSQPTARFSGKVATTSDADFAALLEVEVAVAGRFEARGILFGTDPQGQLKAVAVGHSARWMEPGDNQIELLFDGAILNQRNLTAPFVVKDLRLIHQNRMALIHRQEQGFQFD